MQNAHVAAPQPGLLYHCLSPSVEGNGGGDGWGEGSEWQRLEQSKGNESSEA